MSSWQTKPGNSNRGWNDPPMFIYGAGASTSQPTSRRNVLSKRVAFPVDTPTYNYNPPNLYQNVQTDPYYNPAAPAPGYYGHNEPTTLLTPSAPTSAHNFHLLPPSTYSEAPSYHGPVVVPTMPVINPPPQMNITHHQGYSNQHPSLARTPLRSLVAKDPMSELPVAAVIDDSELQVPNFADDEQMFHYCVTRLQRALNDCLQTTESRLLNEMQKKLNIFSDMWIGGKISYPVKSTMARLATAIHRRKCNVANELHLALVIDHISEVNKWLVGIKKLIQEVEKVPQQPISPSVSCSLDSSRDLNAQPMNLVESLPVSILESFTSAVTTTVGNYSKNNTMKPVENVFSTTADQQNINTVAQVSDNFRRHDAFTSNAHHLSNITRSDGFGRHEAVATATTFPNFDVMESLSGSFGGHDVVRTTAHYLNNNTVAQVSDSYNNVVRTTAHHLNNNTVAQVSGFGRYGVVTTNASHPCNVATSDGFGRRDEVCNKVPNHSYDDTTAQLLDSFGESNVIDTNHLKTTSIRQDSTMMFQPNTKAQVFDGFLKQDAVVTSACHLYDDSITTQTAESFGGHGIISTGAHYLNNNVMNPNVSMKPVVDDFVGTTGRHLYDDNVTKQVSDGVLGNHLDRSIPTTWKGTDFHDPMTDQFKPRLSCSPPRFDPFNIEQCFNGHGELALKFADKSLDEHFNGSTTGVREVSSRSNSRFLFPYGEDKSEVLDDSEIVGVDKSNEIETIFDEIDLTSESVESKEGPSNRNFWE